MPEIKRKLIFWSDTLDDSGYLIDDNHTLKDILRHVFYECGDPQDFMYLAEEVFQEECEVLNNAPEFGN